MEFLGEISEPWTEMFYSIIWSWNSNIIFRAITARNQWIGLAILNGGDTAGVDRPAQQQARVLALFAPWFSQVSLTECFFCMEWRAAPYKWLLFSYMSFIMLTCLDSTPMVDIVWWAWTKLRSEAEAPKPKPRSIPNSSFSQFHGSLRLGMFIPVLGGSLFTGYSHIHKYIRCVYNICVDVVCNSGRTETCHIEFLRCIFYFFLKYEVPHLSKRLLEVQVALESTKCVSSQSCHQQRSFCRSLHLYSHTANGIYLEPARV